MKTTVINSDTRPDLFKLAVDKLDDEGKVVTRDVVNTEGEITKEVVKEWVPAIVIQDIPDYDLIKRKSAKGIAEIRNYSDKSEIWHGIDGKQFKLAEQAVYLEYSADGEKWIRSKADSFKIDEISLDLFGDIARVDIDSETGKQTFTVAKNGYQVRCVWEITRFQAYDDCFDDLRLDYQDYKGNVSDSDWIDNVRTIVFEEKGVKDKLVVDPYLGVDEQSSYIDVGCDGYTVRVHEIDYNVDMAHIIVEGTLLAHIGHRFEVGSTWYSFGYDSNRVNSLIENEATRVVISITGNMCDSSHNLLANSTGATIYLYIYPDSIGYSIDWVTSASITIDDSAANCMLRIEGVASDLTNETNRYEDNGDESSGQWALKSTANYIAFTADEINILAAKTYLSETSGYIQYSNNNGDYSFGWNNTTLNTGTHTLCAIIVIDASPASGSLLYAKSDRLAIGNEFTNISTDLTTTGLPVTDRNVPATLNTTSGFCADGAFHVKSDSNNAGKLTIDRSRALLATVIEDWPIMSGDPSSPTEHSSCFLKCDDNAASSTITATTGNNANWEAVSDGSSRNTNSTGDSVDGLQNKALDTQNGTAYIDMSLTEHANAFFLKGSIFIICKPQFGYDDASDQTLFHVYVDSNNYLLCIYSATNDRYEFTVSWGGTSATVNLSAHTADGTLQIWDTIKCAWDSTNNIVRIDAQNDCDADTNSGTPSSSNPTKFTIGAKQDRSSPGDYLLDNIRTYNTPILPYGSFIPANIISGDVGYDMAHSDITLYSNTSSLDIGTTSVTDISNISNSAGTIAFQVDPSSSLSADETLFSAGTNFKIEWINADNDIKFTYGTATVQTSTSLPSGLDGKHWIVARYEVSDTISIEVDGLVDSASASTAPTLGSAIAWSSNVSMTKRTITSKQNTSQLWTANLIPLILPDFKSEVA